MRIPPLLLGVLVLVHGLGSLPVAVAQDPQPLIFKDDYRLEDGFWIKADITLYRSGHCVTGLSPRSLRFFSGFKGRAVVVFSDARGNAIWVSDHLECRTVGSKNDPTTSSQNHDTRVCDMPPQVAANVTKINVHYSTGDLADLRSRTVKNVRDATAVAEEVRKAIKDLK